MKKLVALMILSLSLASCAKSEEVPATTDETTTTVETPVDAAAETPVDAPAAE